MKLLSVIIPTYNSCEHLPKCLASVLYNIAGVRDVEIIIVDDASNDCGRTRKMLQAYASQYKIIRPIYLKKNMGTAGARNVGLRAADGKYVCFIDDDDCLDVNIWTRFRNMSKDIDKHKNFFGVMVRKLQDYPDIVLCGRCYGLRMKEYRNLTDVQLMKSDRWQNVIYMYNMEYMTGFLFRRDFLKENKLYFSRELPLNDDMLFAVMAGYRADKISIENSAIYVYNYRAESQDHIIDSIKRSKIMRDYIVTMASVITVMMLRSGDFNGLALFHERMKNKIMEYNIDIRAYFSKKADVNNLFISFKEILPPRCDRVRGLCNECDYSKTCMGQYINRFAMGQIRKYMPRYHNTIKNCNSQQSR